MEPGREKILLVDDDDLVRNLVQRQLTGLGYVVTAAGSASEALELVQSGQYDLLLTDMIMPGGMNGRDLALHVRALAPNLPILLSSGYMDNAMGDDDPLQGHLHLLAKPYRKAELAAKVRALLDGSKQKP